MTATMPMQDQAATTRQLLVRTALLFPGVLFLIERQLYSNVFGVNRDVLTVLMLAGLCSLALIGFLERLQEGETGFLLIDTLTISQAVIAGLGIVGYWAMARVSTAEAVFATYFYCLAPFLIYAAFFLRHLKRTTVQAVLIASALAYGVAFLLGIGQLLGIDSHLLDYERGYIQVTSDGFARANGLYGTQIDYGCLSFFAFTIAFYLNRRRPNWGARIFMSVALLGGLTSISRVPLAGIALVIVVDGLSRGSFRARAKRLVGIALICVLLYPVLELIGGTSTLMSQDPLTQASTEDRLAWVSRLPRLLLSDYPLVGTGPGSQNGPGGPGGSFEKIATDFMWLGFLIDFGALLGAVLVLCRLVLLGYLLFRAHRFQGDRLIARITIALTLMFLLASFVDSAYVHAVTVAIFYILAGCFLYQDKKAELPALMAAF